MYLFRSWQKMNRNMLKADTFVHSEYYKGRFFPLVPAPRALPSLLWQRPCTKFPTKVGEGCSLMGPVPPTRASQCSD